MNAVFFGLNVKPHIIRAKMTEKRRVVLSECGKRAEKQQRENEIQSHH